MNYAEKYNMKLEKVREPLEGALMYSGLSFLNNDELPEVRELLPFFDDCKIVEEQGWEVRFLENPETKSVMFVITLDGHDGEKFPGDVEYELCKKYGYGYNYFSINNAIVEYAKVADENPLTAVKTLYNSLAKYRASYITLRSSGYVSRPITFVDVNGESRCCSQHTFLLIGRAVYDIMHGIMGMDLLDYFSMIYENNSGVRLDTKATILYHELGDYVTSEEVEFINCLTSVTGCASGKDRLQRAIEAKSA